MLAKQSLKQVVDPTDTIGAVRHLASDVGNSISRQVI